MICKGKWNKHLCTLIMILGAASFLFGLLTFLIAKPESSSTNTLMGMFTGFGAGIMGVAIWQTIRVKVVSREKLEQEEIEKWDERNIAIIRASATAAYYAAILLMTALIFLFMGLATAHRPISVWADCMCWWACFSSPARCWKRKCNSKAEQEKPVPLCVYMFAAMASKKSSLFSFWASPS